MNEKHRRMWIRWLEGHCECCGGDVVRAKFIDKSCPRERCSFKLTAINEQNLLEHLTIAWQSGRGPAGRPQGPAWTALREAAGEFSALDDEKTGIENLDMSMDKLLQVLVSAGG